jgi:hypothetical protein
MTKTIHDVMGSPNFTFLVELENGHYVRLLNEYLGN